MSLENVPVTQERVEEEEEEEEDIVPFCSNVVNIYGNDFLRMCL